MRLQCTTTKLKTSMFIHTDHDERGRMVETSWSGPGKFRNSQVSVFLDQIFANLNDSLRASPRPPEVKLGKSGYLHKLPPAGPNPAGGFLCPEV